MTAREEWDATTRQAAMRRHPSSQFSLDEVNPAWTDCDQLAAWTARLDGEPTDHPIPDAWAVVMILFLGIVVPWVIVIAAVRWAVR
jgi:hypothetical protein